MNMQQQPSTASGAFHDFLSDRVRRIVAHCIMATMAITPVMINPAHSAISDMPLYLTSPVEPNIMFVLDDSGSMHWEILPDNSIYSYYVYPRAAGIYGGADYTSWVPTYETGFSYSARMRSPQTNPLYYNPAITYKPWSNADGSPMANAVPTAAFHNPTNTGAGSRNLTVDNTQSTNWDRCNAAPPTGCTTSTASQTFYPAVYFYFNGGDEWNWASYTQQEIRDTIPTYTGHGRTNRTDCTSGTCTYAQEIQNFANWYTYNRSRILTARSGIGKAFASQGTAMRVGFGAINKGQATVDGQANTSTVVTGVRSFSGANRTAFFTNLYGHTIPTSGTPLRRALDDIGQYYSRSDNQGPWGNTPGTNDGVATSSHLQCRQSYTILMTDGYWNTGQDPASTAAARLNVDGTAGPSNSGPSSTAFTYAAVSPFTDGNADTLADVAMYYWKNDLRSNLTNTVPKSTINPAFWQHMSTFGVGLGVTGSINATSAFNAISTGATITWPVPTASDAAKLDDLLHASVNGRGGFFTASDPDTFATELGTILNAIVDRVSSSSAVASNSTRLTTNTHLYQALFKSGNWTGQLKAYPLLTDGTVGSQVWDAADVIPAHGSRNIKTWNGSTGTDFSGAMGTLTAAQVDYVRGNPTGEVINGGTFRNRRSTVTDTASKLGDIVNADPHYVKNENFGYNILAGAEGTEYSTFLAGKDTRTAMVYAGANDGMLHGFRASDGVERFAFVPNAVWPNLPLLTSPSYTHKYFIDGSPTAWDAYWGTSWKTVLAGSLGAGGKAVYLLNVSNPDSFGTSNVLWEFKGNTTAQQNDMGFVMGTVTVARFADGNYWAVFGNGYESTNGNAVLFMVRADSPSTVITINAGGGTGNGMSTPILVDTDGDRIIDSIYAGDLKGNLWKFNVTNSNTGQWKSAYLTGSTPKPLFTAKDASGNVQPITAIPEVGVAPTGASGYMVYFGTGKYYEPTDNTSTTIQSLYGVVDSGTAFSGTNHRTSLVTQQVIYEATIPATIVGGVETSPEKRVRVLSDNPVNYSTSQGWVLDLLTPPNPPGTQKGERVITGPALFGGKLLTQSIVPSTSACEYGGASWFMQLNPATGGRLPTSVFDVNNDGSFNNSDMVDIGGGVMANVSGLDSGVGISGGFGTPISAGANAYVPLSGTTAKIGALPIQGKSMKPRASWRQIQ